MSLEENCIEFRKNPLAGGYDWKDTTTYSRGDSTRIPTMFSTSVGDCLITITCGHIYHKGDWIFHCFQLGFDTVRLGKDFLPGEAAEKAIEMCRAKVQKLYEAFNYDKRSTKN